MKPIVNNTTCMFLPFGAFPAAFLSTAGATNKLRRLAALFRSCHRCGDHTADTFALGAPLTSTRLISEGFILVIGIESFLA